MRTVTELIVVSAALWACSGGQTSIGAHNFGVTGDAGGSAGMAGAGASAGAAGMLGVAGARAGCSWSGDDGLLAEWRANGSLQNEVPCSPLQAEIAGDVRYGVGHEGQAWQLRSAWTSVDGGDPNFIRLVEVEALTLTQLTLDAWVQQTGFNDYKNSNRMVFSTSYRPLNGMLPGEAQLYVHENKNYLGYVKTGAGDVPGEDWAGCHFRSLGEPEMLAPLDTWFRLTLTYDGQFVRCYRDGVLDTETPLPIKQPASSDLAPLIGRNYPGDVDALRLFNRALSPDELSRPWP